MTYEAKIIDEGFSQALVIFDPELKAGNCVTIELIYHSIEPGCVIPEAIRFTEPYERKLFEAIAQALWDSGWKPSNLHASDEASKRHLNDMRAIAFGKLNIDDPEKKR